MYLFWEFLYLRNWSHSGNNVTIADQHHIVFAGTVGAGSGKYIANSDNLYIAANRSNDKVYLESTYQEAPYFRNNQGDYKIIHAGNISSQSVNYANSAGNADTLDGVHNGRVTASKWWTTSHIDDWYERSDWDGTYFWLKAMNGSGSTLPSAVQYSTSAGNADTVDGYHGDGLVKCYRGVDQAMATSGYWCAMSTKTGIDGNWRHVLNMDWTGSDVNNWMSQLSIPTNGQRGVYYRSINGSSIANAGWVKLMDADGTISWSNVTGGSNSNTYECNTISLKSTTPFNFYGSGSSTYNQACMYVNSSNGIIFETPTTSPNSVGTVLPFKIMTRGGGWADLYCKNAYANSDRSRKKDIQTIDIHELNILFDKSDKLFKKFTWKQSNKISYGLIAQELEKYIPEAIVNSSNKDKSVSYNIAYAKIIASLINEIKILKKQIQSLF